MNLFDFMDKLEEELDSLPKEELIKLILHFARNLSEFQRNNLFEYVKKIKKEVKKKLKESNEENEKIEEQDQDESTELNQNEKRPLFF